MQKSFIIYDQLGFKYVSALCCGIIAWPLTLDAIEWAYETFEVLKICLLWSNGNPPLLSNVAYHIEHWKRWWKMRRWKMRFFFCYHIETNKNISLWNTKICLSLSALFQKKHCSPKLLCFIDVYFCACWTTKKATDDSGLFWVVYHVAMSWCFSKVLHFGDKWNRFNFFWPVNIGKCCSYNWVFIN